MPFRSLRQCTYPGCTTLVQGSRCGKHPYFKESDRIAGTRQLYNSRWWREFRKKQLELYPNCYECQQAGHPVLAKDVDHPIPHRGDEALFKSITYDPRNSKCKRHHAIKTHNDVSTPPKKSF